MTGSINQSENDHKVVEDFKTVDGGGARFDQGKLPLDMIPPIFIRALGVVFGAGAKKYARENWYRGMSWRSTYACMMRHACKWYEGEDYDVGPNGTGAHHLAQVAWNACALLIFSLNRKYRDQDDRPFKTLDLSEKDDWAPVSVDPAGSIVLASQTYERNDEETA